MKFKYLRPTHIKSYADHIVKIEIISKYQIIVQTNYEIFLYRCEPGKKFGVGILELTEYCTVRYSYVTDILGQIHKMAIAIDKENIKEDTIEFSGADEVIYDQFIKVFHAQGNQKKLRKEFEIHCNESNGMSGRMNWPPSDLQFDKKGMRLIVLNKLCTMLCVYGTFKMDWQLQSQPLVRFHRGMVPVRLSMPL